MIKETILLTIKKSVHMLYLTLEIDSFCATVVGNL